MKKILYGIATALILITIILACTNPGMQDFIEYVKKRRDPIALSSNLSSERTILYLALIRNLEAN